MVTLKNIAERCNVSLSTVSKALKDSPEIGRETILMVQEMAEEMGYHPNSAARALKTNRTYNIGVIFEDKTGSGLQHQYFATIFDSLKVEAEASGYDITFISNNLGGRDDYFKHTQYRGCDGVVIAVVDFSREDIGKLLASDIPVTTLDYTVPGHSAVLSDNVDGMRQMVEYVVQRGHTRLALIHGEGTKVTENRVASFLETCRKFSLQIPESFLIPARYHLPSLCEDATRELLAAGEPPTCIFYPDDFALLGGLKVIQEKHLKVGEDISIVGYDGILLSSLLHPRLTTYRQDGVSLGKQLAFHLIRKIENPGSYESRIVSVPGEFVPGASVRDLSLE